MKNPMIHLATTKGSVVLLAVNRIESVEPGGRPSVCEITMYSPDRSFSVEHSFSEVQKKIEEAQ